MNAAAKNIVVLGSTGSIGVNTLEVVQALPDKFNLVGLSAHTQFESLIAQSERFHPSWIAATDESSAREFDWPQTDAEVLVGHDAICRKVIEPEVDVVLSAIVGVAGLQSNWAAIEAGENDRFGKQRNFGRRWSIGDRPGQ